ncbi:MAG: hypothetical protein LLG03_02135 [Planctomycetaceae bacterium]|nr:hypothetical protein [Planctomycetaceae bacterium]
MLVLACAAGAGAGHVFGYAGETVLENYNRTLAAVGSLSGIISGIVAAIGWHWAMIVALPTRQKFGFLGRGVLWGMLAGVVSAAAVFVSVAIAGGVGVSLLLRRFAGFGLRYGVFAGAFMGLYCAAAYLVLAGRRGDARTPAVSEWDHFHNFLPALRHPLNALLILLLCAGGLVAGFLAAFFLGIDDWTRMYLPLGFISAVIWIRLVLVGRLRMPRRQLLRTFWRFMAAAVAWGAVVMPSLFIFVLVTGEVYPRPTYDPLSLYLKTSIATVAAIGAACGLLAGLVSLAFNLLSAGRWNARPGQKDLTAIQKEHSHE